MFNNWGLKLISLSIAFALWFVVININDPIDNKSFSNVKVQLVNTELLTDKGKVYEVLEGTNQLRSVSFDAPKSIREKIEAGDIIAEADFNDMTSTDTVPIKFVCTKYGNDVTNIEGNISYVKLRVEEKISKWIDVKYKLIGKVAEGHVVYDVVLDQNRLEITGPASKISEVSRAEVDVNITDITNNISTRGNIQLRNGDGGNLNYDNVTMNIDNVKVSVVVYETKEIPVEYSVMGIPRNGYMQTGEIEADVKSVVVAAPKALLNSTNELVVPKEELDITDATENLVKDINLRRLLPSGMIFEDKTFDGRANVTVYIEEVAEEELELTKLNLQITNKPLNMVVEYANGADIPKLRIRGLERYVSTVNADDIRGIIDIGAWMNEQRIEELSSGTYQIPVDFALTSKIEQVEPVLVTIEVMTPEEFADRAKGMENIRQ